MDILTIVCVVLAIVVLLWLALIDLKLWILPDELVIALAVLAIPFHISIGWDYGGVTVFLAGALAGGGALWLIRTVANFIYGVEALGLGDVKLLAAAGLWLGPESVFMALSAGAFCGVLHAFGIICVKKIQTGQWQSMRRMALPAGPGFIAGILLAGLWMYRGLPL